MAISVPNFQLWPRESLFLGAGIEKVISNKIRRSKTAISAADSRLMMAFLFN